MTVWLLVLLMFLVGLYKLGVPVFLWVVDLMIPSSTATKTDDSAVPQIPVLAAMSEATFSAKIKVSGATSGKARVMATDQEGGSYTATADDEGYFDIEDISLSKGTNTILVWAENDRGEQSNKTQLMIDQDSEAPILTMEAPTDGQSFSGLKEKNVAIKGSLDEDGRVRVNGTMVWLDSGHKFSQNYTLQQGDNLIRVEASDLAGNLAETVLTVKYQP